MNDCESVPWHLPEWPEENQRNFGQCPDQQSQLLPSDIYIYIHRMLLLELSTSTSVVKHGYSKYKKASYVFERYTLDVSKSDKKNLVLVLKQFKCLKKTT
jgi:hypothetical protein